MDHQGELRERVKELMKRLILLASTRMPRDVVDFMRKALSEEDSPVARKQLETMLLNIELAKSASVAICQDTGTPYFYLEVGDGFPLKSEVVKLAVEAVREATKEVPLRPNAVDPLKNRNTGDNTGRYIPWVDVELVPGDELKIHFMAKGGGSEYPTVLALVPPAEGLRGVKRVVLEAVLRAGPMPCPPVVVGVGMAAGADMALKLAKKSLLRPLGVRHEEPEIAKLEEELLGLVNKLGIGPHGFGGKCTALDVKVDYAHRHPGSFAVGVTFSCWALRRASGLVRPDGRIEVTSEHV